MKSSIFLVLSSFRLLSQDLNNLPIAKEVWSQPVKVDSLSYPGDTTVSTPTIYHELVNYFNFHNNCSEYFLSTL
jgi:hypothetical protein